MRLWTDRVLPRFIDRTLGTPEIARLRSATCAGLRGEVVELGFGSGLNLAHLPAKVTRVVAIEPSDTAWRLAAGRVADARMPVLRGGLDGRRLDLPDTSADAVLTTFTLCSVPDLAKTLAECRRVLRPGGLLHYLEHGLAPDRRVQRWQRRLDPLQRRFAGGCHLTREIDRAIRAAGFAVEDATAGYDSAVPSTVAGYLYRGAARAPA